ncbi:phenylalanine--tRNA ligase subunit beta, partial [Candidatus Woesearchaeota archaeon]|nr:phenylalanine--tRNA ligase subunit beta [Candidatus Woesearchaeota archaeon]
MPTVKLNKKVFEELVGKTLPIEELKDRISMLGTDLEGIEGNEINVEVFPNRPDMLSEQGFARAFSSFIGEKTGFRKYDVKKSNEKVIVESSTSKVRPYTACAIVKNIKFDDEKIKEVIQIQEKLHVTYGRNRKKVAIGVYPLEKIKFPITFFAEDPKKVVFRPLEHAEEINGLQVLSKHSTGREYGHLLEGKETFPFFKDANNQILSMPPIINSHDVGKVSEETTDLFIECSGFEFDYLHTCLNMVVTALADMGGEIYSVELEYGKDKKITPNLTGEEWELSLDYINKRLGLELTDKELSELLSKMGHDYKNGKVKVPSYRADIMHPIDFVEEVAIAYGYENFEEEIPEVSTIGEEDPFEKFSRKVSEILTGLGLIETETYNLTNAKNQNEKMLTENDLIELESAVNSEFNVLRYLMTPCLMEVLNKNLNKEYPQKIFGIGRTFNLDKAEETGIKEIENLAITICDERADFTNAKQVLDFLMRMVDKEYTLEEVEHPSYILGRCGKIMIGKKFIGHIGEIHPQVLDNWEIPNPVGSFEINLRELFNIC